MAFYNDVKDAERKDKRVKHQGLKWYGEDRLDKEIRKDEACTRKVAEEFLGILGNGRVLSFAFHDQVPSVQDDFDITDLSDERSLDNLHMRTVRLALESLIYDVLPRLINKNASISVYVATRQRWFTLVDSTRSNRKCLLNRWAIQAEWDAREQPPCLFYKSIRNDFFPSFFSQILAVRKQTRPPAIKTGCGVTFTYENSPPQKPFRHVHYVADMIAHNMRQNLIRKVPRPVPWSEWTPSEEISPIIEETDERFLHVLSASRDIQSGERVLALLKLFVGVKNLDANTASSYERFAVGPIQRELIALTGEEFIRLCKLIALSNQGGRPVYDLP